jgi:hypothetical protein
VVGYAWFRESETLSCCKSMGYVYCGEKAEKCPVNMLTVGNRWQWWERIINHQTIKYHE